DPRRPARGPAALPRMGRRDHRRRRPHHRNPPRADAQAQPGQRRARPVPQRARRRPRPPPRRRPDLRPAHRHQPARADVPRRPAGHRHPAAGRRPRDHRQPHHQRHAHPAPPPRPARPADPRTRPDRHADRGAPALRPPRAPAAQPGHPGRHPHRRHHHPRPAPPTPPPPPLALPPPPDPRAPRRFPDPDRFDPDRTDNQHLGFGTGIHICYGAPLARTEAQVALPELARRLVNPRLVTDPPPYRPSPVLRGPRHLHVDYDTVPPAEQVVRAASPRAST